MELVTTFRLPTGDRSNATDERAIIDGRPSPRDGGDSVATLY
ncbi:MAG TPA: hypothetical protein VFY05_02795 [Candidatus Angelobacter sp.]|nr:hypothetical protein [Candidatus Angelobacter sp.]